MAAGVPATDATDRKRIECPHAYEESSTGLAGGIVDTMSSGRMLVASASCSRGAPPGQDNGGGGGRQTERALLPRKG